MSAYEMSALAMSDQTPAASVGACGSLATRQLDAIVTQCNSLAAVARQPSQTLRGAQTIETSGRWKLRNNHWNFVCQILSI